MRIPIIAIDRELPVGVRDVRWYLARIPCRFHAAHHCVMCRIYGGHGPYWYARWSQAQQQHRRYMGRYRPQAITDAEVADALQRFQANQQRRGLAPDVPEEVWRLQEPAWSTAIGQGPARGGGDHS